MTKQVIQPSPFLISAMRSSEIDSMLVYAGSQNVDYLVLEKMYRDPDVERFVFMRSSLEASMIQSYRHPNKEIQEFVWKVLREAEGSFHLTVADAFADCVVYGHHFSEVVWQKTDDGKYTIKRYVYIEPDQRAVVLDRKFDIVKLNHMDGDIPKNKLLYLNFRPNRGLFGESTIASLYPYYLLLRTAMYNYGKTLERFGFPWAIGKSHNTKDMLEMLQNMYSIASAAISESDSIELIEPDNAGEIFERAMEIALSAYVRKLGIPELMVNVKNHGTYNLGAIQFQWFLDENENSTKNKNDVLINAFVKPIVDINYGPQDDYGDFVILKSPNAETMKQYASILQSLSQGNSLNDNVRYQVYEHMGMLPEVVGDSFEKIYAKGGDESGKDSDASGKDS